MTLDERIKKVAEYFTSGEVAMQSVNLAMPSRKESADNWFKARTALGISGYMDANEAEKMMRLALDLPTRDRDNV